MPTGVPRQVTDAWLEGERRRSHLVRVVVYLDVDELRDLELLVRHRRGGASRSAVVRRAVGYLRAKEAAWLVRARAAEERRAREAAELAAARAMSGEDRERLTVENTVAEALTIVRGAA
jgi:hypothetical protein